jgi:GxxExxY protein
MTENEIGTMVVESAIEVHRELGLGLLETVYEVIIAREVQDQGLVVERQVPGAKLQLDPTPRRLSHANARSPPCP